MVLFVNPILLQIVSEKPQGEFTIKGDDDDDDDDDLHNQKHFLASVYMFGISLRQNVSCSSAPLV